MRNPRKTTALHAFNVQHSMKTRFGPNERA
jgi:hypothetical protein